MKEINPFIMQTAYDYCMTYEQVEKIYNSYPDNFYEHLEEYLKSRQ